MPAKTFTCIFQHTNGLIYPTVVRNAHTAGFAEHRAKIVLGPAYTLIATIEAEGPVTAPAFGIGYEIDCNGWPREKQLATA